MTSDAVPTAPLPHTKWHFTILFGIAGSLLVGLVVLAFVWPVATASVKDLPIAISGPAASVTAVEKAVHDKSSGVIDFSTVDDRAKAVSEIKHREVYGAIILPSARGASPEVLTAPAASTIVSQLLTGIAGQLQVQLAEQVAAAGGNPATVTVKVTSIVPLASTDKNGIGLTASSFPLVLGGMLGGILISFLVVGVIRRLVALLVYAAATGTVVALILQTLFGILQGDFVMTALALGVSMLATASIIVGCTALLGTRGIAVGSVVTMLIGNPISAASLPVQFLVGPFGTIGQYFVPGAASALVRDLSYFPEYDATKYWLVLAGWTVLGLVLSVSGHFRSQAAIAVPANELEPEAERAHIPAHRAQTA